MRDPSLEALIKFENAVTWMYLDTAPVAQVTCGIGQLLATEIDALRLPWDQSVRQVRQDFYAVKRSGRGYSAQWYKQLTLSRLPMECVEKMAAEKLARFRREFSWSFPHYSTYPAPAQQALDDLMYNLGPFWPAAAKGGKPEWPKLTAAVQRQDWAAAALQSHRPQVSAERNKYVADLFTAAAGEKGVTE